MIVELAQYFFIEFTAYIYNKRLRIDIRMKQEQQEQCRLQFTFQDFYNPFRNSSKSKSRIFFSSLANQERGGKKVHSSKRLLFHG